MPPAEVSIAEIRAGDPVHWDRLPCIVLEPGRRGYVGEALREIAASDEHERARRALAIVARAVDQVSELAAWLRANYRRRVVAARRCCWSRLDALYCGALDEIRRVSLDAFAPRQTCATTLLLAIDTVYGDRGSSRAGYGSCGPAPTRQLAVSTAGAGLSAASFRFWAGMLPARAQLAASYVRQTDYGVVFPAAVFTVPDASSWLFVEHPAGTHAVDLQEAACATVAAPRALVVGAVTAESVLLWSATPGRTEFVRFVAFSRDAVSRRRAARPRGPGLPMAGSQGSLLLTSASDRSEVLTDIARRPGARAGSVSQLGLRRTEVASADLYRLASAAGSGPLAAFGSGPFAGPSGPLAAPSGPLAASESVPVATSVSSAPTLMQSRLLALYHSSRSSSLCSDFVEDRGLDGELVLDTAGSVSAAAAGTAAASPDPAVLRLELVGDDVRVFVLDVHVATVLQTGLIQCVD